MQLKLPFIGLVFYTSETCSSASLNIRRLVRCNNRKKQLEKPHSGYTDHFAAAVTFHRTF